MAAEFFRHWRHAGVPGVDLLRARFVTHRYAGTRTRPTPSASSSPAARSSTTAATSAPVPAISRLLNPEVVHTGQAGGPAGWSYRVPYPAVEVVTGVAADLGWRPGTPSFPRTVLQDQRSARLLRTAHVAAERGDRLASCSLLREALAQLLTAHADQPGAAAGPPGRAPAAVRHVRELLAARLADPPRQLRIGARQLLADERAGTAGAVARGHARRRVVCGRGR
jgi:hypothetical protein